MAVWGLLESGTLGFDYCFNEEKVVWMKVFHEKDNTSTIVYYFGKNENIVTVCLSNPDITVTGS
jgi:hypothetical protein